MGFKDSFKEDLENTFFDLDEFASVHIIDGKKVTVILTEEDFIDNRNATGNRKNDVNPKETAVNKTSYKLFIKEKELNRHFTVNSVITLDGKKMFIQKVKHPSGYYELIIGENRI